MAKTKFFQFKVTLRGLSNPEVWRRVTVPTVYTFDQFHRVLQVAFGWSDYHMYEFTDGDGDLERGKFRISIPSEYDAEYEEKTYDSRKKKLTSIFPKHMTLTYLYDFGDDWNFEVQYEMSFSSDFYPFASCLEGGGATPPEDCGGVHGYEEMMSSLASQDDEGEEFRKWLGLKPGEDWEPDLFHTQMLRYINIALAYLHVASE